MSTQIFYIIISVLATALVTSFGWLFIRVLNSPEEAIKKFETAFSNQLKSFGEKLEKIVIKLDELNGNLIRLEETKQSLEKSIERIDKEIVILKQSTDLNTNKIAVLTSKFN